LKNNAAGSDAMPTSTSSDFGRVNRRSLGGSAERQTGAPFMWNFNLSFGQSFFHLLTTQNNRWKTPICLLLVPFQRQFSQYKFAVELIQSQVEEQSAPEL